MIIAVDSDVEHVNYFVDTCLQRTRDSLKKQFDDHYPIKELSDVGLETLDLHDIQLVGNASLANIRRTADAVLNLWGERN